MYSITAVKLARNARAYGEYRELGRARFDWSSALRDMIGGSETQGLQYVRYVIVIDYMVFKNDNASQVTICC